MNAVNRINILLIEDNEDDYVIVRDLLRDIDPQKFTLEWVSSYEDGLKAVQAVRHDLILLDFRLSYHTGLELLQETRLVSSRAPVIFMTGQGDYEIDIQAMQSGAVDYLGKDRLDPDTLERAIRYAVERQKATVAVQASEERYRTFMKNSTEGICRFELDPPLSTDWPEKEQIAHLCRYARVAECNDVVERMYGFECGANVLTPSLSDFLSSDMLERAECLSNFVSTNYESVRCDTFDLDLQGMPRYISHTLTGVVENGFLHRVWGILSDITERKRTEDALRASEAHFRTLIQSSWDVFHLVDTNGRITYESPSVTRVLGYQPHEMVGHNALEFVHPDDINVILERASSHPGNTRTVVLRVRHKDGSWRWVESFEVNLIDNADVGAIAVNYRDITERKEAEEALRTSEASMAVAQRIAHIGSWEMNAGDTGIIDVHPQTWSDETFRIFGYEPGSVPATNELFLQAIPPEDHPIIKQAVAAAIAQRQPCSYAHRIRRPNGEERIVQETVECFDDEATGQPARLVGTVHDITEQRRAEEALRKSKEEFASAFENAPIGMALVAPTGRLLKANASLCELLGYTPAEISDLTVQEITHPDDLETDLANMRRLLAGEIRFYHMKKRFCHKGGNVLWTTLGVSLIRDSEGLPQHFVSQIQDITVQREAQEQLEQSAALRIIAGKAARLGGWTIDLPDRVLTWSDENCVIHDLPSGYSPTLEEGVAFYPPEYRAEVTRYIEECAQDGTAYDFELPKITAKGRQIWVRSIGEAVRDDDGRIVRLQGAFQDITERKQAEETRDRFIAVLDATPDFVGMSDSQGRNLYLNLAARKMMGIHGDADTTDLTIAHYHPAHFAQQIIAEGIPTAIRDGAWVGETAVVNRNGQVTPISQVIIAHKDSMGEVQFFSTIGRDITERKHEEAERKQSIEALQLSEQRLRLALESGQFGTFQLELTTGHYFEISDICRRQCGLQADGELYRQDLFQKVHPDDIALLQSITSRAAGAEESDLFYDYRIILPSGSVRWITVHGALTYDDAGMPFRMLGITQDITERKQAEEALRQSEERFALAVRGSSDGIWDWNVLTDDNYYSPRMKELMGYKDHEIPNVLSSWETRLHPADHDQTMEALSAHIERHLPYDAEYRLQTKLGEYRWFRGRGQAIWDENGQATRMAGSISDITELKEIAESLRSAQADLEARVQSRTLALQSAVKEAERANAAKSEFLSRMSHELRTPMNSILGFAQIMAMDSPSATQAQRLVHIMKAGQHLLKLINEVLDTARVEAGILQLSSEPVSLNSALRMATELIQPLCQPRGQQIVCDWPRWESLYVKADQQRLSQVFINLLSNAVKFNRAGGSILVRCEQRVEGRLRVSISDSGLGIPADQIEKLFQPFERLGAERERIEGTGLGLVLSKRLVELMNGTIGVESVAGTGSTFWVELPLAESPVKAIADVPASIFPTGYGESKHNILYIEDNIVNFQVIDHVLSSQPQYRLMGAMGGREGLHIAHSERPSLILLDLHLPDLPGNEVLSLLQKDPLTREIPVVIISADATEGQIRRLMAAGATSYITKPIDVRLFLDVLRKRIPPNEEANVETVGAVPAGGRRS